MLAEKHQLWSIRTKQCVAQWNTIVAADESARYMTEVRGEPCLLVIDTERLNQETHRELYPSHS